MLRQLTNHLAPLFPLPQVRIRFTALKPMLIWLSAFQVNLKTGQNEIFVPPSPTFNASERPLVGKWKAYLKWEESNPLEIEEKDKAVLIVRLQNVYKKAVIRMRYYTEIWYVNSGLSQNWNWSSWDNRFMAYTWMNSVGKHDEAISIIRAGLEANPCRFA